MTQPAPIDLVRELARRNQTDAWPPPSIPYGVLRQRHPEADAELYDTIEDLYAGGWQIQAKAKKYLTQVLLEHRTRYDARCKTASYRPYFGQIVDQFVADLFTQPLSILPPGDAKNPATPGQFPDEDYYTELAANIDGEGNDLVALAADALTTALKHQRGYIMVDGDDSPASSEFRSRADEDAAGARAFYAYEIKPKNVIDWKRDRKTGVYAWLMLWQKEQERDDPTASRDTITETFTAWSLSDDGTKARWARYSLSYKDDRPPRDDQPVLVGKSGVTSFPRIPLHTLELPKGLWVGNKIGTQALEHWRRRSELVGAESVSCVAIPFAKLGPEMPPVGDMNSEAQQDPGRLRDPVKQFEKQGFLVGGKDDSLEFAEPTGGTYEIIDKQIDDVRESMFSVNHQMAASVRPTTTALGRSGMSKQKDEDKTNKVLRALGRIVRKTFLQIYDTISKARNEDVKWVAHGLDSYESDDREQILEEAISLGQVAIPSVTFRKEHAKRIAAKVIPNLPPATVAQIAQEIEDGTENEQELNDLVLDAKKDLVQNPPAPPKPAVNPPSLSASGVKPPKGPK